MKNFNFVQFISTLVNSIFNTGHVELLPFANLKSGNSKKEIFSKSEGFQLNRIISKSLLSYATLVLMCGASWGQNNWTGTTSTTWLTPTNWSLGVPPNATSIEAFFNNNTQAGTNGINMNGISAANSSIGSIHFGASATTARTINNSSGTAGGTYTLNGTTINSVANTIIRNNSTGLHTIAPGGSTGLILRLGNATDNIIQIDAAGGITISSIISQLAAGNKLTKGGTGAGILTLSGANTYTGATTINGGTLKATVSGALPSATALVLANTSGAILDLSSATVAPTIASLSGGGSSGGNINFVSNTGALTINQTSTTTYSGLISGTGAITKSGAGVLTLGHTANTYTGATTITAGELRLNPSTTTSTFASQVVLNGGKLSTTSITAATTISSSSTLKLNANSSIDLGANAHSLKFANSSAVAWTGSTTLTINGWTGTAGASGTAGQIFIGTATGTLIPSQLGQIIFTGFPGTPILLSTGELVPQAVGTPTLSASALTSFGSVCINTTTVENSYTITGTALTTADVTVAALSGFTYSTTAGGSYTSSLTLTQAGGAYSQIIYVRFSPTAASSYNGNITIGGGGATGIDVAAAGSGINTAPAVSTTAASAVGTTTTSSGGSSLTSACGTITSRGVVWGLTANPTIPSANSTSDGTGTVAFTSSITGLTPGTLYNYRAYVTNSNGLTSYGSNLTFTTLKNEPTNYPTSFTCGTTTSTSIPLTWTDASAGVTPDGYLIQWSNTGYGSITPPADGTAVTDLASAVLGAKNIAQGVGSYSIPSLSSLTTYYIRIWSYTNSGGNVNYKLVSEPQTSCATLIAPVTIVTFPSSWVGITSTAPSTSQDANINGTVTATRGAGLVASSSGTRFSSSDWPTSGTLTLASNTDYITFTVNAAVGYLLNLNNAALNFTLGSSTSGPTSYGVYSSVGGFASTAAQIGANLTISSTSVTFPSSGYDGLSTIEIRIYGWGGTLSTGTGGFASMNLTGNLVSLGTLTTSTSIGTSFCAGATGLSVPFTYTPSVNFPSGTATFTAQLSNAAGSFASPVTLQSVTSDGSGSQSISATIPALTTTGTGYRIRIVSASPGVNGSDNASNISISNTATSIAPSTTQNISTSTNGTTLTISEGTTATSRVWKYGTVSGVYGTSTAITTSTYTPNFVLPGTYYIVCETTYPAPCSNVITSNEVQVNVVGSVDYTWNGSVSSNWSNSSNWTPNGVPIIDDNVTFNIPGSNTLIVTDARSLNSLTVSGTGTFQLTSSGSLSVNGNISSSIAGSPTFDCASSFSILSTASQTIPSWNFGNLIASGGARVLSSTGSIGICGTFTPGAGAYTNTSSTVNFNGTGAQSVNALSYNNLTISGARTTTNITLGAGTIGISGTFSPTATFSSGAYVNTGNTIDYNGTGAQTIAAFSSYNNLTISGARSSATVTLASGTIGVAGTFNPSASAVTYTSTGNTFNYTSSGSQTIAIFSQYNNLSNSGNGARTLANGIIAIYGTYTPTSAAVTVGTSTVDFAGTAGQTIPASFYYNITNSSNTNRTWANAGIIDIKSTFTPTTATNTITGSTIQYSATTPGLNLTTFTTNVVGRNYNNLIFNGTGGNWSLNGNTIGVANDLTVSAGTLLIGSSAGAATLNIDGNLTIATGAVFNATNSTTLSGSINLSGNFSNAGILQKSAGGGTSVFTFNKTSGTQTFSNTGTISNNLGFNIGSGSTANTVQLISNIAGSSSTYIIATGSTIDFQTFILTGSGAFTSNSGSSIITANVIGTGAITNTGANGSIQTLGTRIYNATTNFTFNGASAQNTGNGFALANNVTINNASGVTLTSAATVNGVLTFTSGLFDIAAVNLTIGLSGSITGVNTTKYVKTSGAGQLKMTVASSNVVFPVGRSAYNPLTLNNSGTSDVFGVVLTDAISQSLNNSSLVVNRSWNITENIAGGSNLSIVTQWNGAGEEAASFAGGTTRRIAYWNGSAWVQTGAVQAGANPYTFSSSANLTGIASATYSIAMGKDDAFICTTAPTVTLILPISGYSGDVITINGTGLTGLTSATVGGTAATILSQSGASATLGVGAGSTGVITVSKSAVCSASGSQTFTFNGYISAQTGNWSLGSTWQGGVAPSDLVAVTIASSHVVTVDDLTNPSSVVINAGGELTGTDDAQQLFVGSTGNGLVSVSGTLSLGSALVSNGWLVCGTLSVNNGGIFNNNCGNAIAAGLNVTSLTLASGATYNHNALGSTLNGTLSDFPGLTGGTNISINSNANVNITKWAQNTGTPSSLPSVFGGQWGNLTVNISGLTYSGSWQNSGILTNATSLNIVNTGTRDFRLVTPTGVSGFTCNIGSVNVSGGIFVLIGGGSTGSGVVTMNVTNDFNVSGGVASIHGSSVTQSYNTTGVTLNVGGNLNITGGSFYGHANSQSNILAVSSSATTLNVTGNLSINNATLNLAYLPNYNIAGNTGNVNLNLKGNLTIGATGILGNSNSIAPLGKTTATVNFNHASAQQTWTQTGAIQDVIGFNVNGTANKLQLLSDVNIGTSTTSSFNVANATTFDMQAFVLGGSGTFTSVAGSTLKLGNANGITAAPTASGNIQFTTSRNFNGGANYTYTGSVNQVTGNGLPSTITGVLSISNTGVALNNIVTLTTTGTSASTLNLTSGLFAAGAAGQLNISAAGTVNGTGGDFETGANAGILNFPGTGIFTGNSNPFNVYTSGAVNFGAGTVTIQPAGTFRINTGGSVITNAPFYSSTSTLNYNTTGNYGRGLEWSNSTGRGYPHHVTVSNSTTFQPGDNSNQNTVLDMAGDLTIDAGSTMNLNAGGSVMNTNFNVLGSLSLNGTLSLSSTASKDLYIGGDWTRSGVFNHNDRKVVFNRQTAGNQTLSSGGLETFYDLEVSLASGNLVSPSTAITVNKNLNFASGKMDIGENQLTIGTTLTNGTITNASSSNYVITDATAGGGNIKAFTNSNTAYVFPVGDATNYSPMSVTLTNGAQVGSYITTSTVQGAHPNLLTGAPPTKYISRYWSVEPTGLEANPVYNVSFSYVAADEVGIGTLYPIKYSTSTTTPGWLSCPGSTAAAVTGTSGANDNVLKTFTWAGLTTFSDFSGAGDGSPLPVTWLNFDAQFNNTTNNVDVSWTTASEINNDYFEVMRSVDAVNFEVVGTVDGAGNSSLVKDYAFVDTNPLTGLSYYKIRQVDFNGQSDNTEIRAVSNLGGVATGTLFTYPNPLIGQDLTIVYSNLDKGNWDYRLVDITGKIVLAQNRTSDLNAGAFTLNLEQLPAGIYLFQLNTQSQNFTRKITISR